MNPLLLLAILVPTTRADSTRVQWHLWSWTRADLAPSYTAEQELRAEQQLALDLSTPDGWRLDAVGALRDPAAPEADLTGDLYRATVRYRGQLYSFALGRLVLLGGRGLQRLDGLSIQAGRTDDLTIALWGGRLWQPETWEPGDTWVGGLELRSMPTASSQVDVGYEARDLGGELRHRVHFLGSLRSIQGSRISLLTESEPFEEENELGMGPARLELSGTTPASGALDLGATARWEGLSPATQPEALVSPMDWLAGPGYAALDLNAGLGLGDLRLSASASPTWRTIDDGAEGTGGLGALGRVGAHWQAMQALGLGISIVGAQAEPSWVAGAVGGVEAELGQVELGADLGWFRFRPQTGPMAEVTEARLEAGTRLPVPATGSLQGLTLLGEIAGGADRLLAPWLRGGLVLRGELGNRPAALP